MYLCSVILWYAIFQFRCLEMTVNYCDHIRKKIHRKRDGEWEIEQKTTQFIKTIQNIWNNFLLLWPSSCVRKSIHGHGRYMNSFSIIFFYKLFDQVWDLVKQIINKMNNIFSLWVTRKFIWIKHIFWATVPNFELNARIFFISLCKTFHGISWRGVVFQAKIPIWINYPLYISPICCRIGCLHFSINDNFKKKHTDGHNNYNTRNYK